VIDFFGRELKADVKEIARMMATEVTNLAAYRADDTNLRKDQFDKVVELLGSIDGKLDTETAAVGARTATTLAVSPASAAPPAAGKPVKKSLSNFDLILRKNVRKIRTDVTAILALLSGNMGTTSASTVAAAAAAGTSLPTIQSRGKGYKVVIGKATPGGLLGSGRGSGATDGGATDGGGHAGHNYGGFNGLNFAKQVTEGIMRVSKSIATAMDMDPMDVFKGVFADSFAFVKNMRMVSHETKGWGQTSEEVSKQWLEIDLQHQETGFDTAKAQSITQKEGQRGFTKELKYEQGRAVYRKRNIKDQKEMIKTSMHTAFMIGANVDETADMFSGWQHNLQLSNNELDVMGQTMKDIGRTTNMSGANMLDLAKSSEAIFEKLKSQGSFSASSMKNVTELMALFKQGGAEEFGKELITALTSFDGFLHASPELSNLIGRAAHDQKLEGKLYAGNMLQSRSDMQKLFQGMENTSEKILKRELGGRKLEDIPKLLSELDLGVAKGYGDQDHQDIEASRIRTLLPQMGFKDQRDLETTLQMKEHYKSPLERMEDFQEKKKAAVRDKKDTTTFDIGIQESKHALDLEKFQKVMEGQKYATDNAEAMRNTQVLVKKAKIGNSFGEGDLKSVAGDLIANIKDEGTRLGTNDKINDFMKTQKQFKSLDKLQAGMASGDLDTRKAAGEVFSNLEKTIGQYDKANDDPQMQARNSLNAWSAALKAKTQMMVEKLDLFGVAVIAATGALGQFSGSILSQGIELLAAYAGAKIAMDKLKGIFNWIRGVKTPIPVIPSAPVAPGAPVTGRFARVKAAVVRTSDRVANLNSTIGKRFSSIVEVVGKKISPIIEVVSKKLAPITEVVSKRLGPIAESVTRRLTPVGKFIGRAGGFASRAVGTIERFVGPVTRMVSPLTRVLTPFTKLLGPLGLAYSAWSGASEAESLGLSKTTGGAFGLLTGGADTGSSVAQFFGVQKGSKTDLGAGVLASAAYGALLGSWFGPPGAIVGGLIGATTELIKINWDSIKKGFSTLWDYIKSGFKWLFSWLGGDPEDAAQAAVEAARTVVLDKKVETTVQQHKDLGRFQPHNDPTNPAIEFWKKYHGAEQKFADSMTKLKTGDKADFATNSKAVLQDSMAMKDRRHQNHDVWAESIAAVKEGAKTAGVPLDDATQKMITGLEGRMLRADKEANVRQSLVQKGYSPGETWNGQKVTKEGYEAHVQKETNRMLMNQGYDFSGVKATTSSYQDRRPVSPPQSEFQRTFHPIRTTLPKSKGDKTLEKAADSTVDLTKKALDPGSIFVHDTHAERILLAMLGIMSGKGVPGEQIDDLLAKAFVPKNPDAQASYADKGLFTSEQPREALNAALGVENGEGEMITSPLEVTNKMLAKILEIMMLNRKLELSGQAVGKGARTGSIAGGVAGLMVGGIPGSLIGSFVGEIAGSLVDGLASPNVLKAAYDERNAGGTVGGSQNLGAFDDSQAAEAMMMGDQLISNGLGGPGTSQFSSGGLFAADEQKRQKEMFKGGVSMHPQGLFDFKLGSSAMSGADDTSNQQMMLKHAMFIPGHPALSGVAKPLGAAADSERLRETLEKQELAKDVRRAAASMIKDGLLKDDAAKEGDFESIQSLSSLYGTNFNNLGGVPSKAPASLAKSLYYTDEQNAQVSVPSSFTEGARGNVSTNLLNMEDAEHYVQRMIEGEKPNGPAVLISGLDGILDYLSQEGARKTQEMINILKDILGKKEVQPPPVVIATNASESSTAASRLRSSARPFVSGRLTALQVPGYSNQVPAGVV
jgi:hypothetical protein